MLHLEPVPALEDNYIWVMHDRRCAVLVDPGEAVAILTWLADHRIRPVAILVSHRHGDHVGGIPYLVDHYPGLSVYGPDGIAGVDHPVAEGDHCHFPDLGLDLAVWSIPGHTLGHLAFVGHGWLFCGDTLFACGCGKVVEGTAAQLHASLDRLAGLPPDTLVCCSHEYTLDNLRFALSLEPGNPFLLGWQRKVRALRQAGRPTLPTRLDEELAGNPFLRCRDPALLDRLADRVGPEVRNDAALAFAYLRSLKDRFA